MQEKVAEKATNGNKISTPEVFVVFYCEIPL